MRHRDAAPFVSVGAVGRRGVRAQSSIEIGSGCRGASAVSRPRPAAPIPLAVSRKPMTARLLEAEEAVGRANRRNRSHQAAVRIAARLAKARTVRFEMSTSVSDGTGCRRVIAGPRPRYLGSRLARLRCTPRYQTIETNEFLRNPQCAMQLGTTLGACLHRLET